jgi:hypothetical protein
MRNLLTFADYDFFSRDPVERMRWIPDHGVKLAPPVYQAIEQLFRDSVPLMAEIAADPLSSENARISAVCVLGWYAPHQSYVTELMASAFLSEYAETKLHTERLFFGAARRCLSHGPLWRKILQEKISRIPDEGFLSTLEEMACIAYLSDVSHETQDPQFTERAAGFLSVQMPCVVQSIVKCADAIPGPILTDLLSGILERNSELFDPELVVGAYYLLRMLSRDQRSHAICIINEEAEEIWFESAEQPILMPRLQSSSARRALLAIEATDSLWNNPKMNLFSLFGLPEERDDFRRWLSNL